MLDNNVASVYAELNAKNIEILTKKCVRKVLGVFERWPTSCYFSSSGF